MQIFVILGVGVLILGLSLLKRGRWPRRVGQTAHCPKCDYILAGQVTRCSECGTPINARNIVRGERPRRASLTWSGIVLAIVGLLLLSPPVTESIRSIPWIHYEPLSWLLRDLGSGNTALSIPAWDEIQRRISANRLSDSDQSAVVDKGLQVGTLGVSRPNGDEILDYIASRWAAKKLTVAQADQFFAGMLKVNLTVRPVVGTLSRVPYFISGVGRGPNDWWMIVRMEEARIDDGPIQELGGESGGSFSGWTTGSTLNPITTPGKHRLHLKIELSTNPDSGGGVNWDEKAVVARRVTQELSADFQVVRGPTPMTTVSAPSASALQPLLSVRMNSGVKQSHVSIMVDAKPPPVNLAFDVFLRINGKEYPAGTVNFHAGANAGFSTRASNLPAELPSSVDVIFRSSEGVARETADMTQIWKGQIVLPNIPVPGGGRSSTRPATNQ